MLYPATARAMHRSRPWVQYPDALESFHLRSPRIHRQRARRALSRSRGGGARCRRPRTIAATGGRVEKALGRDTEMSSASIDYLAKRGGYSIDKARRVLGYEPKVELEEGMRRCEEWLRSEGLI